MKEQFVKELMKDNQNKEQLSLSYREQQIQEIAARIRDSGNTCMISIYAVMDLDKEMIVNHKKTMFYTTRQQARDVNRLLKSNNKNTKVVKADFVNVIGWKTAR